MAAEKKTTKPARVDRAMFSIGSEASEHLDYLVGRHIKADGSAGTSRSDVLRDLIERAYRQTLKRGTRRGRAVS